MIHIRAGNPASGQAHGYVREATKTLGGEHRDEGAEKNDPQRTQTRHVARRDPDRVGADCYANLHGVSCGLYYAPVLRVRRNLWKKSL